MPLVSDYDHNELEDGLSPSLPENTRPGPVVSTEQPAGDFIGTLKASFEVGNTVVSAKNLYNRITSSNEDDPEFHVFDIMNDTDKLYPEAFVDVRNKERYDVISGQIARQEAAKKTLSEQSYWYTIPSAIVAGVVDPLSLIPITSGVKAAKVGADLTRIARFSQAAKGLVLPSIAVGATAEGIQYAGNITHTEQDVAIGIAAAGVIGPLLGGGIAAIPSGSRLMGQHILRKALKGEDYVIDVAEDGSMKVARDAGAAETRDPFEDVALANINENLVKGVSGFGIDFLQSPVVRGLTSKFNLTRLFTDRLFNHNFRTKSETLGIGTSPRAEELIKWDDAALAILSKSNRDSYMAYTGKGAIGSTFSRGKDKMSLTEWNERIAHALRHPDPKFKDSEPGINAQAAKYRKHLDDIAEKLQLAGFLPKDMDKARLRMYLSRQYKIDYLYTSEGESHFLDKVGKHYQEYFPDGTKRPAILPLKSKLGDDELSPYDYAMETLKKIRGDSGEINITPVTGKAAFLKERALLMDDIDLEEFLVNDVDTIVSNYSRKTSAMLRVHEQLKAMGFDSIEELLAKMDDDLNVQLKVLADSDRAKLSKAHKKEKALVKDMYDLMTGKFYKRGTYERITDTLLNYQFTRLLGNVSITSMSELAMAPFRTGFINTIKHGYLPMLRSMKTAGLARNEWKHIGFGLEAENSKFLKSLAQTDGTLNDAQNKYDRAMNSIVDVYAKATLLPQWTAFGRRLGAQVSSGKLIDLFHELKVRAPTQADITELAHLGVGVEDIPSMIEAVTKGSEKVKGSWFANHLDWEDKASANKFKLAVQRMAEGVVIQPSKGDVPLWAQRGPLQKIIFQFSSFSTAATNKILLSGLQRRDKDVLVGVVGILTVGMFSNLVKQMIAGKDIEDISMDKLMLASISSSGLMGYMGSKVFDLANTMINYNHYTTDRYYGNIAGPTVATGNEIAQFISKLSDGNVTDKDIKAGTRLLPFYNIWLIQTIMNNVFGDEEEE